MHLSLIIGSDAQIVERTPSHMQLGHHPPAPFEEHAQMIVINPGPGGWWPECRRQGKSSMENCTVGAADPRMIDRYWITPSNRHRQNQPWFVLPPGS
jgi:hypothetical protein